MLAVNDDLSRAIQDAEKLEAEALHKLQSSQNMRDSFLKQHKLGVINRGSRNVSARGHSLHNIQEGTDPFANLDCEVPLSARINQAKQDFGRKGAAFGGPSWTQNLSRLRTPRPSDSQNSISPDKNHSANSSCTSGSARKTKAWGAGLLNDAASRAIHGNTNMKSNYSSYRSTPLNSARGDNHNSGFQNSAPKSARGVNRNTVNSNSVRNSNSNTMNSNSIRNSNINFAPPERLSHIQQNHLFFSEQVVTSSDFTSSKPNIPKIPIGNAHSLELASTTAASSKNSTNFTAGNRNGTIRGRVAGRNSNSNSGIVAGEHQKSISVPNNFQNINVEAIRNLPRTSKAGNPNVRGVARAAHPTRGRVYRKEPTHIARGGSGRGGVIGKVKRNSAYQNEAEYWSNLYSQHNNVRGRGGSLRSSSSSSARGNGSLNRDQCYKTQNRAYSAEPRPNEIDFFAPRGELFSTRV